MNSGNWRQNNYDLTLSDHRGDSASAGYRYTRDTLEEINLSLKAVLTSSLGATYLLRRNQLDRRTVESTYGLQYRKQCWNVELNVSDREGRQGRDGRFFTLRDGEVKDGVTNRAGDFFCCFMQIFT